MKFISLIGAFSVGIAILPTRAGLGQEQIGFPKPGNTAVTPQSPTAGDCQPTSVVPCPPAKNVCPPAPVRRPPGKIIVECPAPEVIFRQAPPQSVTPPCDQHSGLFKKHTLCTSCGAKPATTAYVPNTVNIPQMATAQTQSTTTMLIQVPMVTAQAAPMLMQPAPIQAVPAMQMASVGYAQMPSAPAFAQASFPQFATMPMASPISVSAAPFLAAPQQVAAPMQYQMVPVAAPQIAQSAPPPLAAVNPCPEDDLRTALAILSRARTNAAAQVAASKATAAPPLAAPAPATTDIAQLAKKVEDLRALVEELKVQNQAHHDAILKIASMMEPPPQKK